MKNKSRYEFVNGRIVRKEAEEIQKDTPFSNFFEEDDSYDNTEAFENARANFEQRNSRERIIGVSVAIAILAVFAVSVLAFAFPLKTVQVTGQTQYDTQLIAEYARTLAGNNVVLTNGGDVENALLERFTRLESVRVEKDFPNGITVSVTEDTAAYYIGIDGEYYLLSDELRVMDRTVNDDDIEGLVRIDTDGIRSAVTGEELEFYASYQHDYVRDVLLEMSSHAMYGGVQSVDMMDKFDIRIDYDGRFTVILGIGENVNTKLTLAMAYIQSLPEGERGIIDSSSTEKGSYISLMN